MSQHANTTDSNHPPRTQAEVVRETLTGIIIAFVMAFVFRGFVVEGFVIPTGSMAPTLLGKNMRFHSPVSGYDWPVGPWDYVNGNPNLPAPRQGGQVLSATSGQSGPVSVTDPMSGATMGGTGVPLLSGDRVFVVKYLAGVHDPQRWDVAVFKNPSTHENYIKRVVGVPGEQLALVDGDVFTRAYTPGMPRSGAETWGADGWSVQRKPERVQRAMWQDVFDARYTPLNPEPSYQSPWQAGTGSSGGGGGWTGLSGADAGMTARYTGAGRAELNWRPTVALDDRGPYNQTRFPQRQIFPVSDLCVSFGLEPDSAGPIAFGVSFFARGREFRAEAAGGRVIVKMRPASASDAAGTGAWTELDAQAAALTAGPGRIVDVEVWHVDQAVWVFADGALVAGGPEGGAYDLSPAERVEAATGQSLEALLALPGYADGRAADGVLADTALYRRPRVSLSFEGGPLSLHRLSMKRDIHYQVSPGRATLGGHPNRFATLDGPLYFMCGDNSASSEDSRLWTLRTNGLNAWVARDIYPGVESVAPDRLSPEARGAVEESMGLVHQDLLVGKAFIVYFPAPHRVGGRVPVPDVGRMRWIW